MSSRLWYPQLDIFDAIRRLGRLLQDFKTAPGLERLYIADFFLSTPSLLHRTSMPMEVRREFNALKILFPDKSFVDYPGIPLFFHKMESIQKQAIFELRGRGLISEEALEKGSVALNSLGIETFRSDNFLYTQEEMKVSEFLTKKFLAIDTVEQQQLRSRTGLRRPS
jgi:hypothetical protein